MTRQQVIETLERYNRWRRGEESEMLDVKFIGQTIDQAIQLLKDDQTDYRNDGNDSGNGNRPDNARN